MDEGDAGVEEHMPEETAVSRQDRRPLRWTTVPQVLGRAAANFAEDSGTQLAASISYYTLFSLFPLTLLAVAIFGTFLRDPALQERVLDAIIDFLPVEGPTIAESLEQAATLGPTVGIVSFFGALWSAGALSAAVRRTMDRVFEVSSGRPLVRAKLIDFVLIPVIGLPLLGGLVLTGVLRFFERQLGERWGLLDGNLGWTWDLGAFLIPLALSFVAFTALYRLAPNKRHPMRFILPGAFVAALGFEGLKSGFAWYLDAFGNYAVYGPLGSVIVLLFWVYLAANILIFGAEISAEIPHITREEPRHGSKEPGDWKRSLLGFVQGLVMASGEDDRGGRGPIADRAPEDRDPAVPLPGRR